MASTILRSMRIGRLVVAVVISGFVSLSTLGAAPSGGASAADGGGGGPHFYSGAVVDVTGRIDGDVYVAGQSVVVSGDVTGDVIAAGQTISITGTVDGNVRLAGQDVTISGEVARSGTIFASSLLIAAPASVGNDVVAAAGAIRVRGEIGRDLMASTSKLTIDGTVAGNVTYTSETTASISRGAVDGTVRHIEPQRSPSVQVAPWAALLGWLLGVLYALVALSVVTVAAGLLVPRWLHRVTDQLMPSPWRALLVGFVAAIAVPIALFFLLVTVIGAPLAFAGILIWSLLTLATFLVGAFYVGRLVLRGSHHPALTSFVGGLILIALLQIPWLNILVWLAMVFFGLGAQLLEFRRLRPWTVERGMEAAPRASTTAGQVDADRPRSGTD